MGYATKQREALLNYLKDNPDRCFTVSDIVKDSGLPLGKATVYRALSYFTEAETVKKYITGEGDSALYQYSEKKTCESHFHLRCMRCGRLFHTECNVIGDMISHLESEHGFKIDAVHTTIYGVCRECDAAQTDATNSTATEEHSCEHNNSCRGVSSDDRGDDVTGAGK